MKELKRIFLVFGIAFIVFSIASAPLNYNTIRSAIQNQVFNHLTSVREILKYQIERYFHERNGDINTLSNNPILSQSVFQFSQAFHTSGPNSSAYSTIENLYQPLMAHYIADYGYTNMFLVDKDGDVVFSALKNDYHGTNLLSGEYRNFSIATVFRRGREEITFEDLTWNESKKEFTSYVAAPIKDNNELLGVLILEIPFLHMDAILTQREGLGETGEMYIVGDDGFMRSNSRFSKEPTVLQKEIDTEATRNAFNGITDVKIIKDYRGVEVLSAYTPLNLKFLNWILLVEIDVDEAFNPINSLKIKLIIMGSIIGSIAIAYLYLAHRKRMGN